MYPELNSYDYVPFDKWILCLYDYPHFPSRLFNGKRPHYRLYDRYFGNGYWDEYEAGYGEWHRIWRNAEPEFITWCDLMHSVRNR